MVLMSQMLAGYLLLNVGLPLAGAIFIVATLKGFSVSAARKAGEAGSLSGAARSSRGL